jgi:predicted glycoside hydrolase/deacetylase ChbG (UPF0249 family)
VASSQIVFVADDFGLSDEVNEAIVHAHAKGVLTGASLMMGQPATERAVTLAREHPALEVGWHLHLNDSRPCTVDAWPWGRSPARAGVRIGLSSRIRELARREIRAQWEAFRATGLRCRFVNAHHHMHIHPVVRREVLALIPAGFEGWVRWGRPMFFDGGLAGAAHAALHRVLNRPHVGRFRCRTSTTLWGIDRTFAMRAEEILAVRDRLGPGLHEFMFHPRSVEADADLQCLLDLRRGWSGPTSEPFRSRSA